MYSRSDPAGHFSPRAAPAAAVVIQLDAADPLREGRDMPAIAPAPCDGRAHAELGGRNR